MLLSMNAPAQAELGRATLESKMKTIVWVTRPSGNGATTNQEFEPMRRSNFALRMQPSLLEELRKAAEAEGVAVKPAH